MLEEVSLENEKLQKIIEDNKKYVEKLERKLRQYEFIPKWIVKLFSSDEHLILQ